MWEYTMGLQDSTVVNSKIQLENLLRYVCVGWCLGSSAWAKWASFLYSGASCSYGRKWWNTISHCVVPPFTRHFTKQNAHPWGYYVIEDMSVQVGTCEGGPPHSMNATRECSWTLRRTLNKYRNLQACERLSFYRNIGRSPLGITPQGSSAGGDVSKYTEKWKDTHSFVAELRVTKQ